MKHFLLLSLLLLTCLQMNAQQRKKTGKDKAEPQAAAAKPYMKLYPIEADKYVNIYVEFLEAKDIELTLEATDRSNEKSWKVKAATTYQHSLDVSALPPGNYSILLRAESLQEKMIFTVKR